MSACTETDGLIYRLHGTTLQTPLGLACAKAPEERPAFQHVCSEHFIAAPSHAEPLAWLRVGNIGYRAVKQGGRVWMNFFQQCEFVVTDQGVVQHRLEPAGDSRLLELFLPNALMAVALGARGVPLLHASCVETNGAALAVAGASGAGKSSIAAALCAAGARLVSDDTLRVDCRSGESTCFSGTSHLRLRPGAEVLGRSFKGSANWSSDGRWSISLPSRENEFPLRCVWLPEVVAATEPLALRAVFGHERLMSLLSNVRISGWSPQVMARLIPPLRQIAASVDFYQLRVPEGLIFTEAGQQQLYAAAQASITGLRRA